MDINHTTGAVVDAAIKVHSALGPGLLESAYHACLAYELRKRGVKVLTQVELPVVYDEIRVDLGYRVDGLAHQLPRRTSQGRHQEDGELNAVLRVLCVLCG